MSNPQQSQGGQGSRPGDEATPGTPGTGEGLCPACAGKGQVNGKTCEKCNGTGKVVEGIGGA